MRICEQTSHHRTSLRWEQHGFVQGYVQEQPIGMPQGADETSSRPHCSVCSMEISKRYLHPMKFLDLLKPCRQAGSQALRWKEGWHAEIEIHGVTPVRKVELSQRSASFEAKGL